jgi:hypothetical protein
MASLKEPKFTVGEIIRIESLFGFPPAGIYRVLGSQAERLQISAGEIFADVNSRMVTVVERGLPEPKSWLRVEVDLLTEQVKRCNCADCRKLLRAKTRELRSQQESRTACSEGSGSEGMPSPLLN